MDCSVVIPVYNSSQSINELYDEICAAFKSVQLSFEVIFVDDYSQDNSWELLKNIKQKCNNVKIISFAKNYGQHNATFCGLKYAVGNYIVTIDDDLQNEPKDIIKLLNYIKSSNYDLVYGVDNHQKVSVKKVGSTLFKKASKQIEGALGEGSSFRVFNSKLLEQVIKHNQHFIYLDELLFWYTSFIGFVEVKKHPRKHGQSSYSTSKLFKLISAATVFYGTWPLKIMTYGGAFFSIISFSIGVYFICKKLFLGVNVPGFTAIIVAISFSTSLILMCFGIIGKYLSNIYTVLNNKPTYSIKEVQI